MSTATVCLASDHASFKRSNTRCMPVVWVLHSVRGESVVAGQKAAHNNMLVALTSVPKVVMRRTGSDSSPLMIVSVPLQVHIWAQLRVKRRSVIRLQSNVAVFVWLGCV